MWPGFSGRATASLAALPCTRFPGNAASRSTKNWTWSWRKPCCAGDLRQRGWWGMRPPRIIAEVGCNHQGRLDIAREMVRAAALFAGVDGVKFQKRNPRECLTPAQYRAPHPVPANAFGPTYGLHRERLELPLAAHRELQALCRELGITYSASVWDMTSAREIMSLDPPMMKVPSACNTRTDLLQLLCDEFGGELHISLGMTTRREEEAIVALLAARGRLRDTVLYACV